VTRKFVVRPGKKFQVEAVKRPQVRLARPEAPCCASVAAVSDAAPGERVKVQIKPCPERVPLGHVMCEGHWRALPGDIRRAIIDEQKKNKARGLKFHGGDWRELVRMGITAIFRRQLADVAHAAAPGGVVEVLGRPQGL
jgi:hypothetical protein